jgi:hypothetical protein
MARNQGALSVERVQRNDNRRYPAPAVYLSAADRATVSAGGRDHEGSIWCVGVEWDGVSPPTGPGQICRADPDHRRIRGRIVRATLIAQTATNARVGIRTGDLSYALHRFDNEAHRIYGVMNPGLFNKRYLAAGAYTIADMICFPWASSWATREIEIGEFPNVKRWLEEIGERPAVKKAMALGPEFREDPASISPEEQTRRRKLVADQRAQSIPPEWVRAA